MNESNFISRHRWAALWNGVVIGLGVMGFSSGAGAFSILPLAAGIGLEVMQRKRQSRRL
ncbi:MAG: hypothetical protein HW388_20 [Dehalococcoidia bacterium]|nr:hypothetical protein [Dehalococcoidia bacterium]